MWKYLVGIPYLTRLYLPVLYRPTKSLNPHFLSFCVKRWSPPTICSDPNQNTRSHSVDFWLGIFTLWSQKLPLSLSGWFRKTIAQLKSRSIRSRTHTLMLIIYPPCLSLLVYNLGLLLYLLCCHTIFLDSNIPRRPT